MAGLTVDSRGRVYATRDDGMPGGRDEDQRLSVPAVIAVNGFQFDPTTRGADNPHQTIFPDWSKHLDGIDTVGFGWFSAPVGLWNVFRAWGSWRWNRYRWAWDLAGAAAGTLARYIGVSGPPVSILAHSLGTRVATEAILQLPRDRVSRVVLLNGAQYSQRAKNAAIWSQAEVLNVIVGDDEVLQYLGQTFAPEKFIADVVGRHGLEDPPPHWCDFRIDDANVRRRALERRGWSLQGDNPDHFADHWFSYKHAGNWGLLRGFLAKGFSDDHLALDDVREIAGG